MPIPTPFHPRTSQLCTSMFWKDWAGYHAVRSYSTCQDREYFAIRQSAALIDVSPLFKYEVTGPDAAAFLAYVMAKDIGKLKQGRVTYLCWCDDDGKVVDDGTVTHLEENHYRVTSAEPSLSWFHRHARGFRVQIEDSTTRFGALSVQGPTSRDLLASVSDVAVDKLKFFRIAKGTIDGVPVHISRTGYTGDLGYEVWVEAPNAVKVYDAILAAGRSFRAEPCGLDAMDVSRIEAGFIMNGVDYFSANHCLIESKKSTPYEINLGWTVNLDRDPFVGQAALKAERARGSKWALAGLVYDWDEFEALYAAVGLPPQVPSAAWRSAVPVYAMDGVTQIGQATSGAWSPTLKKNLALASLHAEHAGEGERVRVEVTVEYHRKQVTAVIAKPPFFDPERKRA